MFTFKNSEGGDIKLKARLFVHVNRDEDKYEVRKDEISVYMMTTRLVLSLVIIMGIRSGLRT